MWHCDLPKKQSSALLHFYSWMQTPRPSSVLGRREHRKFWWGKKIYLGMKTKKKDLYRKCISVVSVLLLSFRAWFMLGGIKTSFDVDFALTFGRKTKQKNIVFFKNAPQWHRFCCFLLGHDFCLGHILAWGHKNLLWYEFCPRIWGWRLKTKQKGLDHKCSPMVLVLLLFLGGTHSRLGAQKPLLVRILPSHLVVKTKNKTKRSWSQMHPNGVGPVAYLWGDTFSLGGTKTSFGTDFALTFRMET